MTIDERLELLVQSTKSLHEAVTEQSRLMIERLKIREEVAELRKAMQSVAERVARLEERYRAK